MHINVMDCIYNTYNHKYLHIIDTLYIHLFLSDERKPNTSDKSLNFQAKSQNL